MRGGGEWLAAPYPIQDRCGCRIAAVAVVGGDLVLSRRAVWSVRIEREDGNRWRIARWLLGGMSMEESRPRTAPSWRGSHLDVAQLPFAHGREQRPAVALSTPPLVGGSGRLAEYGGLVGLGAVIASSVC